MTAAMLHSTCIVPCGCHPERLLRSHSQCLFLLHSYILQLPASLVLHDPDAARHSSSARLITIPALALCSNL